MARVKKVPIRMCVACRQMRPQRELVRVVKTHLGEVKVDPTGKVSGRGAYVCPEPSCVERGIKENRLGEALGVAIPEAVEGELRKRVGLSVG